MMAPVGETRGEAVRRKDISSSSGVGMTFPEDEGGEGRGRGRGSFYPGSP